MDFVRSIESVIPGAQGKVLAVLAETTAPLSLRALARLSGVSPAQVSRVMPALVQLGLVERTEVPPSSLFVLVRDHLAAGPLLALARSFPHAIEAMEECAAEMRVVPEAVWVFGSFARGEADAESDIDVVIVRPGDVDADDELWLDAVQEWKRAVATKTGNRTDVLEVTGPEVADGVREGTPVWLDIVREGLVVFGYDVDTVAGSAVG